MSNNDDISPPPPILESLVDINGNHLFQQPQQQSTLMPIECRNFVKENLFAELEHRWSERQKRKRLINNLEADLSPPKNKRSRLNPTTFKVSENNRFSFGSANPRTLPSPEKNSQKQKQFQVDEFPPPRLSSMQSNASTSVSAFYSHSRLSKKLSKIHQPLTSSFDSQAALKTTTPLIPANLNNFLSQTFMFPQPKANIANPMSSTAANILPQTSATLNNRIFWQQEAAQKKALIPQPSSSTTIILNNLNFNYPLTQNSLIPKLPSTTYLNTTCKNDSLSKRDQILPQARTFLEKTVMQPKLIASKQPQFNSNLASSSLPPSTTAPSSIASDDAQSLLKPQRNFKSSEKTVIGKSYKEIMLTAYLKYLEEEQPFEKFNENVTSLGITATTKSTLENKTHSNINQPQASFNYPQISRNVSSNFKKNKQTEKPIFAPSSLPYLNLQSLEQQKQIKMPKLFPSSNENFNGPGPYSMPSIDSSATQPFYTMPSLLQQCPQANTLNIMNIQSNFSQSQKHHTEPPPPRRHPPMIHRFSPPQLPKEQPAKAAAPPKPRKLLPKKTVIENFRHLITKDKLSFSNTFDNNVINNNKASTMASTSSNFIPETEAIFSNANNQNKNATTCNFSTNIGISRYFYENCLIQNLNNPVEMPMEMFPKNSNSNLKTAAPGTVRSVNTTDSILPNTNVNLTGSSFTLLSKPTNLGFDVIINGQDFSKSNKTGNHIRIVNNALPRKPSPTSSAISSAQSIVDVTPSQNIKQNNFFGLPKNAEILVAREPEKYCFEENERKIILIENL